MPKTSTAMLLLLLGGSYLCPAQSAKSSNTCSPNPSVEEHADTAPIRIQVNESDMSRFVFNRRSAIYPPLARTAKLSGKVKLHVIIGTTGIPTDIKVDQGHPLLVQAALEAAREWRYKPPVFNGCPVQVETQNTFEFDYETNASPI